MTSVHPTRAPVRVGWIIADRMAPRRCLRDGKDDQQCSTSGGRYRIIARTPVASLDGFLCANHLSRLAPALGLDVMSVGPWKDDQ